MAERLSLHFNAAVWGRRTELGLWFASAALVILILLDGLWTLFQINFPLLWGAPAAAPFANLDERKKGVSYDRFGAAFAGRNLFQVQTPEVKAAVASGMDTQLQRIELAGILLGRQKQAIFRDRKTKQSFFMKRGDEVGDIVIREIRPRSVTVGLGEEERELFVEERK